MLTFRKRQSLARDAMKTAGRIRSQTLKLDLLAPINIYDVAERLGVRVVFDDLKTAEGAYFKGNPASIVITSLRPPGRQAFTCGHEFGHHVFKHGDRMDEVMNWGSNEAEEFLVNCFAGYLMMPPTVVGHTFTIRGWNLDNPTPKQAFIVAGVLGVGYTSLLNHMTYALNKLDARQFKQLQSVQPKNIRAELLGVPVEENVIFVDEHWPTAEISVDAEVDDYIVVPHGTIVEGGVVRHVERNDAGEIFQGVCPGKGRFMNSRLDWAVYTRISRRNYTGFARYRFWEDEEFDDE